MDIISSLNFRFPVFHRVVFMFFILNFEVFIDYCLSTLIILVHVNFLNGRIFG